MTILPATTAYDEIKDVFEAVIKADLPVKITADFIQNKLGHKNCDAGSIIGLMEKLGMIAADGTPTDLYRNFRNEDTRGAAFAEAIKFTYRDLYRLSEAVHYSEMFDTNEIPHASDAETLEERFARLMGLDDADEADEYVGTFQSLCRFATFKN